MGVVSKGDARIWAVGVTLLALALVLAWWLYEQQAEEGGETEETPAEDEAHDAAVPTAELDPLAPAGSLIRSTDPVPARALRLLLSTPEGARLCTVGGASDGPPLDRASCEPVEVDATQARLASVGQGAPVAFVLPDAVARPGGTAWWSGAARDAHVAGADRAAVLARTDDAREVVVLDAEGVLSTVAAPPPVGPGSPALVWDQLLWLERAGESDALHARAVLGDGEEMSPGPVPALSERLRGCRSSEALAVAVDGELVHGKKQVAVTFLTEDGWSPPHSAEAGVYEYAMACRGTEATLTWMQADDAGDASQVMQIRCRPGSCEKVVGRASFVGTDPVAVDLAGRVLLVWASEGRTHARLAPLVELHAAEDLPPLPQPVGNVLSRHLYVRGGTAVLVYRTGEGLSAVRIDSTGDATPLPVRERSAL